MNDQTKPEPEQQQAFELTDQELMIAHQAASELPVKGKDAATLAMFLQKLTREIRRRQMHAQAGPAKPADSVGGSAAGGAAALLAARNELGRHAKPNGSRAKR